MNKRFIRLLILFSLAMVVASSVSATPPEAASGVAYNWESVNITIVETVKSGDQTTLTLRDKEQHLFKVSYFGNLPDDVARIIVKYKSEFFSWRNLEMKELKFVLSLDILDIIIIPTRIMYNGNNIVTAIPAGMVFIYDPASPGDGLHYDFKILKDNLIVRVSGKYTTEADFNKNLFRVYDNPKAYLSATGQATEPAGTRNIEPTKSIEPTPTPTPTPAGKSIGTVTGAFIKTPTATNQVVTPTGTPTGKSIVTPTGTPARNPGPIQPENTATLTQKTGTPTPTHSTTLTNADFEFLLDKINQLQLENERLRYALLVLENKELFKDLEPIPREVILEVIRFKRQYPNLSFIELYNQLKKQGIQITKEQLYLILAVYFNEFNNQYLK